jgi:hypothetical protein
MKIALIGNMNNNFSAFCRYLRDEGFDAQLFLLDNEQSHFLPETDDYSNDWEEYTHKLSWGSPKSFNKLVFREINTQFKRFDLCIGCGYVPAFFNRSKLELDVFIPYGSDLYQLPFFNLVKPKNIFKHYLLSKYQKKGILKSAVIMMAPTGGSLEKILKKIRYVGKVEQCGVPMVYFPQYYSSFFDQYAYNSEIGKKILELKKTGETIIFHNSRHSWKNPADKYSQKANNYLFEAFALFLKENIDAKFRIITFEYGPDVSESKALIRDLRIEKQVSWIPLSARKDVMVAMKYSDAVVGELFLSYFSYGVVYESMALKKVIVHNREERMYSNYYPDIYPMIQANSIGSMKDALNTIYQNPDQIVQIGNNSFDWFKKYLVTEPITIIKTLVYDAVNKNEKA